MKDFKNNEIVAFKRPNKIMSFTAYSLKINKVKLSLNSFEMDPKEGKNKETQRIDFYFDLEQFFELKLLFQNELVYERLKELVKEQKPLTIFESLKGTSGADVISKSLSIAFNPKFDSFAFYLKEGKGRLGRNGIIIPDYQKADKELFFYPTMQELAELFERFEEHFLTHLIKQYRDEELKGERMEDLMQNNIVSLAAFDSFFTLGNEAFVFDKFAIRLANWDRESKKQTGYAQFFLDSDEVSELKRILMGKQFGYYHRNALESKSTTVYVSFKGNSSKEKVESRILALNAKDQGKLSFSIRVGPGKETDKGTIQPSYKKPSTNVRHNISRVDAAIALDIASYHYRAFKMAAMLKEGDKQNVR